MHSVIDIPWWRLALAAAFVGLLLAANWRLRLKLGRSLLTASIRGPIQLLAVGYVITGIFTIDRPELVVGLLLVMLAVATQTAVKRSPRRLPGLHTSMTLSLALGTVLSLVAMSEVIVVVDPWYDPQYLIPFGGMLLGNSMNGTALAGERFQEELRSHLAEIEARLALGFTAAESVHPMLIRSLRAALIPMINSLTVAGIVQLPGMMTGQILSGTNPVIAVKYQILIYLLLLFAVAVSAGSLLLMLRRRYLTKAQQVRSELLG